MCCSPGLGDGFRSSQAAHYRLVKFRSETSLHLLGKKHLLFSGVAEELGCKSGSDRGLHVVRAFLKVKLTKNKVEPRDRG